MLFVTFNDAHFSDIPPESRLDEDYAQTLLDKLDQIAKVANKIGARAVLNAGDLFHIKNATRNSHALIQRLTKKFKEMPLVLSIAGNHDITYDRLDTLPKQPLGVLFETSVTKHMHLVKEEFQEGNQKVVVVGLSYTTKLEEFAGHEVFLREKNCIKIGLLHCSASPRGGSFKGERFYSYPELSQMFPGVDVFVMGHLHFYTGIHCISGVHYINIGSLSRCSLHLDNLQRKVYAGLIEIREGKVDCKQLALRVLPVDKVLSVERHNRLKEERKQIESFIESLREETATQSSEDAIKFYLSKSEIPVLVREKALALLEEAGLNA